MASKESDARKRDYVPPKIVHTEEMETRAVNCAMSDDNACAAGPIMS